MDQLVYVDILQNVMLPYTEWNMPLRWVFQQDNDLNTQVNWQKIGFKEMKLRLCRGRLNPPTSILLSICGETLRSTFQKRSHQMLLNCGPHHEKDGI